MKEVLETARGAKPNLHTAIREARKAYQADGTIPDWEAVAQVAEAGSQVAL